MSGALNLEDKGADPRGTSSNINAAVWRELDIGNAPTPGAVVTPADYSAAGYNFVYRQCSNYFDALILYQNKASYTNDVVTAGGSSLGALLGIVKTSAAAISGVAAGTGFLSAAINSFQARALITPYPNETKTLILGALDGYRAQLPPTGMSSPAEAIANVQHYAELCTYSGISRAAKQALSAAKPIIVSSTEQQPLITGASIAALLGLASPLDDAQMVALYWFISKGGACTPVATCDTARGFLPPTLVPSVYVAGKTYIDPANLRSSVGDPLATLYKNNAVFKASVDAFPNAGIAAAAVAPAAAAALVPAVGLLRGRYNLSQAMVAKAPTLSTERFGTVVFGPAQPAIDANAKSFP